MRCFVIFVNKTIENILKLVRIHSPEFRETFRENLLRLLIRLRLWYSSGMCRHVEQRYYLLSLFIGVAGNEFWAPGKSHGNVGGSEFLTMAHSLCDPHCAAACSTSTPDRAFFPQTLLTFGIALGKVLSQIHRPFCSSMSVVEVLTV